MSAPFTDQMIAKLQTLSMSQQSIETISLWLMHHQPRHADEIIQTWLKAVRKEPNNDRLASLIYLANDVLQNSRKKNPAFVKNFFPILELAFKHVAKHNREGASKAMKKCVDVWQARQLYSSEQIERLNTVLKGLPSSSSAGPVLKRSSSNSTPHSDPIKNSPISPVVKKPRESLGASFDPKAFEETTKELLSVLQKLEIPPSSNGEIRQKISSYPAHIANPSYLTELRDEPEAKKVLSELDEAEPIVRDYCTSLANEMLDRRNVQTLLDSFLTQLKAGASRHEELITMIAHKADHLQREQQLVVKAYDSLPDDDEVKPTAPLPSVSELFSGN